MVLKSNKLIGFHHEAFVICKNGKNLKMLIEIIREKLVVANIILAFLDHLKPGIFFAGQPHQILRLFDGWENFLSTTSQMKLDY